MGRAYEYRKAKKMQRWGKMSINFTKIGKEISMAVKQGGADPSINPKLRAIIKNAKNANMPKDNVEAAIKRASSKDFADMAELIYEGYGPNGVAILVETATDNPTRTVSKVKLIYSKYGGNFGTTGSVDFMFERKFIFKVAAEGLNIEDLELELIDAGLDEIEEDEGEIYIYTSFQDSNTMQNTLEEKGIDIISSEALRIPTNYIELNEEDAEKVYKMLDKFEEDDDVQKVFHNMKEI